MKERKLPRSIKIYLTLFCALIFFVFMLPRSPRFTYEYKKGEHWMYETLVAEFDFPILKTDEQLKAEKDSVKRVKTPYFNKNTYVLDTALTRLDRMPLEHTDPLYAQLRDSSLYFIYSKGVFDQNDEDNYLSASECAIMEFDYVERRTPTSEVFTTDNARLYIRSELRKAGIQKVDSIYNVLNLRSLIIPDLEYNKEMTEDVYSDKLYHPSPTRNYFPRSETIVEKGEMITDDIANLLDSYKAEFDKSVGYRGTRMQMWAGLFIVSLVMVVLFFFTIHFCDNRVFRQFNRFLYVLLLYVIFTSITFLIYAKGDLDMFFLIPYSLMSMLMIPFFKKGFVQTIYFVTLLPLLIITSGTVTVFFIHLVAGFVGIYLYQKLNKGWLQFVAAFIVYIIMSVVWVGFCLMFDDMTDWYLLMYIALSAGLSIAGYPIVYLFERMFMLVSSERLVELSDTSNTLLRMLADKAPGTFHHSLQVMNLSDAAARAVGANIPLVRAAALYHDIGKINNPQCFTENEAPGVKVHDNLTPRESAQLITKHVTDGLQLAEKHKLPKVLVDFIVAHHGTTSVSFFLTKYLNDGGDPEDVADFYYEGVKPSTKEHVILMLSDAVEAASRSLKDYSNESISRLVDKIIDGKIADGQLDEADISLKDLTTIREVMKSFLQQMYHSRIEYPKRVKVSKN